MPPRGQSDPILEAITALGSPFEIAVVDGIRRFANAPENLDQLIESTRRHGDRTCIVDGERRLTYADVLGLRDALAAQLAISPGERVALCMRNRAEWLIGYLAIIRAGGVAALINSRGSASELTAAVSSVGAELVLADTGRAELLRAGGYRGRLVLAEEFPSEPAVFHSPAACARPDEPATILFTSGTTGQVKGAVLTHRNVITGVMSVQMSGLMVLHNMSQSMGVAVEQLVASVPQQSVLLVYPLFHISGLGAAFLSPMVAGSKIVILPKWEAGAAARTIAAEKITMFSGVPTMLWDLLHHARDGALDLSSLRNIGTGGQALPINLLDAIRDLCPNAVMGTGYGLTESAGSVAMAVGEDFIRNRAAAGRVLPLVELRIEGLDGACREPGQAGEILIRGGQIMQGYWGLPAETAAVLSSDGWFRTGDIGFIDDEGYLFICDRKKDMVISGGENIYCAEVERVLSEIPEITECATFGIPDERLGELLVAVVRASGLSEVAIIEHVRERLARYKAPARVAFIKEPLPRNQLHKIDKIALRSSWATLEKDPA